MKINILKSTKFITMGLFDFLFRKKKTASESKGPVKKPKSASIRNLHASMSESEVVYSRSDKRLAEYYDTKLKENNQTLDPSNFKYDANYILNYYDHDGDYFSTEYFSQIETLLSKMKKVPEHYKIIQERGIGMHKNFIENNIEVQDQKYWNEVYERHYKSRFDDGSLLVENIKLETNNFELILKEIKKVMEIIEKTKCDFDIQTFCEYYAVKSSLEGLLSFKNNYNDKLFGIKKVEKSAKNKGTQKVYPKSKNHFLEKIDKLEAFSKFSDIQIRNTQITVFKAAVWQLINIDNKITDEEKLKFIDFLKEMDNKFLGDDNDKNDPVIGELIQDPDEMIGVLKTFPDDELELFWDTLFSFSMVDGEFSIEEANLIGIIASGVYDNLSNDEIKEWINNKLA
jgi:hypothetical protein